MAIKIVNYSTAPRLSTVDIYGDTILVLVTVAGLRLTEPSYNGQIVKLLGHTTAGIGGGDFRADLSDTTTADDDGITIVTSGGKRWKRILNGFIDSDMYNGNAKKVIENADTKHAIKLLSDVTIISTINLRSNTTLDCQGFDFNLGSDAIAPLNAEGSLSGSWTNLTSNMVLGTNTLVTTLSLAVGDWVFVRSEALYDDPTEGTVEDPSPVSKYGQIFQITHKSGDTYRTDYISKHSFNTADTAQIRKISVLENLVVKRPRISSINYTNKFTIGFRNEYVVNSVIDDPIFYGSKTKYQSYIEEHSGRSAIKFIHCINVVVNNPKFYHIGWYGIELVGANRNVVVNNIYGHDCRHTFSFNWLDGYGKAIDCHIIGGTGDTNDLSNGDTHANSAFDCCSIRNFIGNDSVNDSGIQLRCDVKVIDCEGNGNALDGIVGRGIGKAPTVINFKGTRNLRNGANFIDYGVHLINPTLLDNASSGFETTSGSVIGGKSERNLYVGRINNNYEDTKPIKISNLYAPQSAGRQTSGIFFGTDYDRSRCTLDSNEFYNYGDFTYIVSSGTGNNSYPTTNKNNKTRQHGTDSEMRGRHTFAGAGNITISTTAFISLVTPTGTRGGGQISNVILTPLTNSSTLVYSWNRVSSSSFRIAVNEACDIEWTITGI